MDAIVSIPVASPLSNEQLCKLYNLMKRFGKHQVPTRLYQLIQKLIENHSSLDKDSKLTTENLASLYLNQL